ncbi:MAG: DAK2 domain-containing protein [Bacillota bacterium]
MKANKETDEVIDKNQNQVIKCIKGIQLKHMLECALVELQEKKKFINSLNVFPVPDGDTGTNMYLTFLSAAEKIKDLETDRVDEITSFLARGALMGARGNSGVILSQLLRGFSDANSDNKVISREKLVESLKLASSVAYHGVLKPVEGTILTVAREAATGAKLALENDLEIVEILKNAIDFAGEALNKTPEQLPALKEAGVVDAGGQGYLFILKGFLRGLRDEKQDKKDEYNYEQLDSSLELVSDKKKAKKSETLDYVYDTQVLIELKETYENNIDTVRDDLKNYGDSLIVVGSEATIKVHIHTNHPGIILEYALNHGTLKDIVVENMQNQKEEIEAKKQEDKINNREHVLDKRGLIAVAQGAGFTEILTGLGVDKIISGGNTNNPSTNDFIEAIKEIKCREVVILPNNKNIISAANQAASLVQKKVIVVETKSIPEAISSLMVYEKENHLEELQQKMEKEFSGVKTIKLTAAIKSTRVNGFEVKKGDILGLYQDDIVCNGNDYEQVINDVFENHYQGEELITIYYGADTDSAKTEKIKKQLQDKFSVDEIEIYNGGQPLYPFVISLE